MSYSMYGPRKLGYPKLLFRLENVAGILSFLYCSTDCILTVPIATSWGPFIFVNELGALNMVGRLYRSFYWHLPSTAH